MEYSRLGRSGLKISGMVLGTMNFGNQTDKNESFKIIDAAIDAGINILDCADVYAGGESERIIGEALTANGKRKEVFIISKVFMPVGDGPNDRGNSKHHILEGCENSLRNLKTDYIDIYFLHRTDFNVPQEETLASLDLLVQQGKIRHVGCSTHPPWRVVEAIWIADKHRYPKFVCEQPPYNLLDRRIENEIVPMCQEYDLGIISWSPLAQGVLAGRYQAAGHLPAGSRGAFKDIYAERITQKGIEVSQQLAKRAAEKEYLSELDGAIGDGDHGVNMAKCFREVKKKLAESTAADMNVLFNNVGMVVLNSVGGAMGALYGTFFLKMAQACVGKNELGLSDLVRMFQAAQKGILDIGKASPGDKTLLDTLVPATRALEASEQKGQSLPEALANFEQAAKRGMASTTDMVAKMGRASRLAERSLGHQDAGATSCYFILRSLASAGS